MTANELFPISALSGSIRVDVYGVGTVWFALEDSQECRAHVCIDGRKTSLTRNRLFDGARHSNDSAALLLDLGEHEEGLVVPIISQWLDSGTPRALGLNEYGWELIRDAVVRIGEPN